MKLDYQHISGRITKFPAAAKTMYNVTCLEFFCSVQNHRQVFEIVRHFRHMVSPGTYPPSSQRAGIRLWVSSAMQHVPSPRATPA